MLYSTSMVYSTSMLYPTSVIYSTPYATIIFFQPTGRYELPCQPNFNAVLNSSALLHFNPLLHVNALVHFSALLHFNAPLHFSDLLHLICDPYFFSTHRQVLTKVVSCIRHTPSMFHPKSDMC